MNFLQTLIAAGASLLFLSLVFIPLEKVFPAKKGQRIFRKAWVVDLCYFFGQYLLWNGLVLWFLSLFNAWMTDQISGN